ncbi:16S rRNA (cytidine(1402)-2'-O)-methyltransferase [Candidatus Poriferisodalis sp.]|uniref:16S rRNA (cytidine(1402)-2'-O)-methyltransferase n=1 Tax=Candidatus Poriferisodalis sp. TaxID=3101277 RepID=UPI003B01037F
MSENEPRLWLVATPIGNLDDIAPRAVEVLSSVSFVACEDIRRSGLLLQRLGIAGRRLVAMHEHNEATVAAEIVQRLAAGETAAYVTDAGMPTVSDPGQRLVAAASAAGIGVSAVPGPSAPVAALAISGLPTDRWVMEGFLPRKGTVRNQRLEGIAAEQRTVVLLESPRRLGTTLEDLAAVCGADRRAVVVRELTKLHEEVARGTVAELAAQFAEPPKGEIVVVLGPATSRPPSDEQITAELAAELEAGSSARDAAAIVAERLGVARNRTYRLSTELARSLDPRMP